MVWLGAAAANGNQARAESASTNVRPAATASERWRIGGTPLRTQSAGAARAGGSPQPSGGVEWGRGAAGSNPQAGTIPRGHRGQVRGTTGGAPPGSDGMHAAPATHGVGASGRRHPRAQREPELAAAPEKQRRGALGERRDGER